MPDAVMIPVLAYADVSEAVNWLSAAFGFVERLRIGDHRAQMVVPGGGAMVVRDAPSGVDAAAHAHSTMVRVSDANALFQRAVSHGARVLHPVTDHAYGERQFTVADIGGHSWTFSQSMADVEPETWGGVLRN